MKVNLFKENGFIRSVVSKIYPKSLVCVHLFQLSVYRDQACVRPLLIMFVYLDIVLSYSNDDEIY